MSHRNRTMRAASAAAAVVLSSVVGAARLADPSCNGQGFDPTTPAAGTYTVTVSGHTQQAIAAGQLAIQQSIGLTPPTNCPGCPVGQVGCAPGNYTSGGSITWSSVENGANTDVSGTVPEGMTIYKVCGLCISKP